MSEVPYYKLKQLAKLTKMLTFYAVKQKDTKQSFIGGEKKCNFLRKAVLLIFFSEIKGITLF